MRLNSEQQEAVELLCRAPVGVITGGPGTGKTTCLRLALEALIERSKRRPRITLCAPTGKAARRMMEATGHEAATIHRTLGYDIERGAWMHWRANTLPADIVICDEASMLDTELAAGLLDAIHTQATRVFFVGDANQLPSVGPGQVFADLIRSERVPVVELREVHRQAQESWVYRNAPRVLAGDLDAVRSEVGAGYPDFAYFEEPRPEAIPGLIVDIMQAEFERIEETRPNISVPEMWDALQVLVPQKKGPCGVKAINEAVQENLHPEALRAGAGLWVSDEDVLLDEDKVIQTKNNYELGTMNGETGVIVGVVDKRLDIEFSGERRTYNLHQARDLMLGYAITVHKCVAANTLISTHRGLQYAHEMREPSGLVETVEGVKSYSKLVRREVSPMRRFVTERGYEITVTRDHAMEAWRDEVGRYERWEADVLRVGDWLRLPLRVDGIADTVPQLSKPPHVDSRAKPVHVPPDFSYELAEWLGLFVADGTLIASGFRLAKRHDDVATRFALLTEQLFGRAPAQFHIEGASCVELCSRPLARWLRELGGLSPHAKAVPLCVRQAPRSYQARFLRGLFEDGSVAMRGELVDHVEWVTASEEMGRLVQVMLLRLGIAASRARYGSTWRLSVYPDSLPLFMERVGFVAAAKRERLAQGWSPTGLRRRRIPIHADEIGVQNVAWRRNAKLRGYLSEETARREGVAGDRLGYLHQRIVSIEDVEGPSYCLVVPDGHRFIQNGFDGWNSQGSEYATVIVVCHSAHRGMLDRRLFYTAITRAKGRLVIVGDEEGLERAITREKDAHRQTRLVERVRDLVDADGTE